MADFAHEKTDEGLEELKKKIRKEYKKAAKEIARKYEAYMNKFADLDKANKQKVIRGEMTKKQYDLWRTNAIATGKRWKQFQDTIATDLTLTDVKAMSMTQGFMPEAYALNYNFGEYEIETQLKDTDKAKLNGSFVLMDSDTAELMIRDNPELLPKPTVNIPKDKKWNADKIHSAMTQGLLQGESNQAIAKRLMHVVGMGANSAIRNARTMTTCAENMGRENSYKRAQKMGIPITREWLATTDERTRSSHMAVNGQRRPIGKKFSNGCMFPGDPSAPGYEIYNCRCTLIASVYDIDYNKSDKENIKSIKEGRFNKWESKEKSKLKGGRVYDGYNTRQINDALSYYGLTEEYVIENGGVDAVLQSMGLDAEWYYDPNTTEKEKEMYDRLKYGLSRKLYIQSGDFDLDLEKAAEKKKQISDAYKKYESSKVYTNGTTLIMDEDIYVEYVKLTNKSGYTYTEAIDRMKDTYADKTGKKLQGQDIKDIVGRINVKNAVRENGDINEYISNVKKIKNHDKMTIQEIITDQCRNTNVGFKTGKRKYAHNCSEVAIAAEARAKGLDVRALPMDMYNKKVLYNPFADDESNYSWIDAFEGGRENLVTVKKDKPEEYKEFIEKQMKKYKDGSRALLGINSHVYECAQVKGKTVFYDVQSGEENTDILRALEYNDDEIEFLRVDNKKFTDIALCAMEELV